MDALDVLLQPVIRAVKERTESPFIIAIDGRSASGKTTATQRLCALLDGSVVHMDDFFLPMELRTAQRISQPGGNIHYERFLEEVLPRLRGDTEFSYRVFDCAVMDYVGWRTVAAKRVRIVEGAYSCHPIFGEYMDLRVFLNVTPEEQWSRILRRNGPRLAERFRTRWIPMEERYLSAYPIQERAEIVLQMTSACPYDNLD